MPELPEVETVRRGLAAVMQGRTITAVRLARRDLRLPLPENFAARLTGRRVGVIERRAKYLIARLDSGDSLLVHLGMTGRFTVFSPGRPAINLGEFYFEPGAGEGGDGRHDHVVFDMEGGSRIVYTDPRRFGLMDIIADGASHPLLANLGIEPLGHDLDPALLRRVFGSRRAPLKSILIDQRIIAGLGNIYACEALFRARLSPFRAAATLTRRRADERLGRLVEAIRTVLSEAVEAGGATLKDYARIDGSVGSFQHLFQVYDRVGAPCPRSGCGGRIRRAVQSGRSTFYCPRCQK